MKNILITMLLLSMFIVVSCGGEDEHIISAGNNFPHEHNGYSWSDVSGYINWDDAKIYCQNLGGRLPTISELRMLIWNCPATEIGGECRVSENCSSFLDCNDNACSGCSSDETGKYSVFGDTRLFWSSTSQSDNNDRAWLVNFIAGIVGGDVKPSLYNVRCVK